jgi:hypothetical protein
MARASARRFMADQDGMRAIGVAVAAWHVRNEADPAHRLLRQCTRDMITPVLSSAAAHAAEP